MNAIASGVPTSINVVISNPLFAALTAGTIFAIVGVVWRSVFQRYRLGWSLPYDEPINQGALSPPPPDREESGKPPPPPNEWVIQYKEDVGQDFPTATVTNGSLVALEIRNIGLLTIREAEFGNAQRFMVRFPGRKIIHYKVRDNEAVRETVARGNDSIPPFRPSENDFLYLPALHMRPGEGFKLLVLLESEADGHPVKGYEKPRFPRGGSDVRFVEFGKYRLSRRVAIAALGVLVLAFGGFIGASIANSAQEPAPACGKGSLTIAGSTAFAPVFTQVVNEYEQHCTDAHITVNPDGSIQGLKDLQQGNANIAMYDGAPQGEVSSQYVPRKVGDVIFAVVGNNSLPPSYFQTGRGNGLTSAQIARVFNDPKAGGFTAVGRTLASGTRQAFENDVLPEGDTDAAEKNAHPCPFVLDAAAGMVCLEETTLQLLDYVNGSSHAIGYAEADALPFFPGVREIPIDGYQPSRSNVLDGHYNFLATERLYTNGQPSGLTKDLIDFLTSTQVTAQMRTTSFIGCSDLSGNAHGGDCQGS
jgi:ABC-type phosphate transport system substrate-binding protein